MITKDFTKDGSNFGRNPVVQALTADTSVAREQISIEEVADFTTIRKPSREPKNRRVQFLLKLSTYNVIQEEARRNGVSMNEAVNQILEMYGKGIVKRR